MERKYHELSDYSNTYTYTVVAGWLKKSALCIVVVRLMLYIAMTDLTEICVKVY